VGVLGVGRREVLDDLRGKLGEIGTFKLHGQYGARVGLLGDSGGGTVFAGVLFGLLGRVGLQAMLGEELLDLLFNGCTGHGCIGAAEVLNGGEASGSLCDCDPDGGELGVEDVFAVVGAVHPALVNLERGLGIGGEILGDCAEVRSSLPAASDEVGLTGVFVLDGAGVLDDNAKMLTGGAGERGVPGEGLQAVLGTCLVGEVEESFLSG
jgi:hypothetical protein